MCVCIQRCYGRVISRKVSKLTHEQCRVEDFLYDRDVQHYGH